MCEACDAKRQQLQGERTVTSRGGSGRGGGGAVQAIRRITTVFVDWENVGIVGPFHSLGAI